MQTWYAIFEDAPHIEDTIVAGECDENTLARFDEAAKVGAYGRREVTGMWIVNDDPQQGEVIRIFGRVPTEIRRRHNEWKAREGE